MPHAINPFASKKFMQNTEYRVKVKLILLWVKLYKVTLNKSDEKTKQNYI